MIVDDNVAYRREEKSAREGMREVDSQKVIVMKYFERHLYILVV
jgi:hypothetical protein